MNFVQKWITNANKFFHIFAIVGLTFVAIVKKLFSPVFSLVGEIICPLLISPFFELVVFWQIKMEYWNNLHKNRYGRVVDNAVLYLLDESRGKSYQRVKSYINFIYITKVRPIFF